MASSKKPRKKRNNNAAMVKYSDRLAKGSMIISVPYLGDDGSLIIHNYRKARPRSISHRDFTLLYDVSRTWSFVFGVYCRKPNGETYLSYDFMATTNQIALSQHETFCADSLKAAEKKVNRDHILSPFMIAIPNEINDVTDEIIYEMLKPFKIAEKLVTHYEENIIRENACQELAQLEIQGDKQTWAILRQNGLTNWQQVRELGFQRLLDFKGIGEIRAKKLLNAFVELITTQQDKLVNYLKLEEIYAKRREDKETIEQARNWSPKEA